MTKTLAAEFTMVESIPTALSLGAGSLHLQKSRPTSLHEGDENTKTCRTPTPLPLFLLFSCQIMSISRKE